MKINFSEKIKEYREIKFLTQQELADILGVTFVSVCRWETKKYEPTMKIKRKLYKLFIESGMKVKVMDDAN